MKIGLEIHVTLNTKTKLFCACPATTAEPNKNTCEVCLGHPGSKPFLNKEAVLKAVKLCKAMNCEIANEIIFSRKNYFYPDLSKNYQITQYEEPLGKNGWLDVDGKKIRLKRIHLEEDPASITREDSDVLIDYNRSGMPLAEIVTEPDLSSPEQARKFMKKLLRILRYLDVFNIDGVIKADINVSIEESGYKRVEIKNVTGFKDIELAITYEAERQKRAVSEKEEIKMETRAWNPGKGVTISMREKESEADYAYIYEPDIPVIPVEKKWLEQKIPELSDAKIQKFKGLGVDEDDADIIAMELELAELFERVSKQINPVLAARWFRKELLRVLNYNKKTIKEVEMDEKHIVELLELVDKKIITDNTAKKILEELIVKPFSPKKYVEEKGLSQITSEEQLKKICAEVVKNNEKAVKDYLSGEEKSFQFLVGQVMRATKGKANPDVTNKLLKEEIKKNI